MALRYRASSKRDKAAMPAELCALTDWRRDHARKALRSASGPKRVARNRKPCPPVYGPEVIAARRKVWAVLDAPVRKRLAPFLGEIVKRLREHGDLDIDDQTAEKLAAMNAATIDRRLALDRNKIRLKGRLLTKPGSLFKSQIPINTWADWDDAKPGFIEIDLVGHERGNPASDFCRTLSVINTAGTWTEPRGVACVSIRGRW